MEFRHQAANQNSLTRKDRLLNLLPGVLHFPNSDSSPKTLSTRTSTVVGKLDTFGLVPTSAISSLTRSFQEIRPLADSLSWRAPEVGGHLRDLAWSDTY